MRSEFEKPEVEGGEVWRTECLWNFEVETGENETSE